MTAAHCPGLGMSRPMGTVWTPRTPGIPKWRPPNRYREHLAAVYSRRTGPAAWIGVNGLRPTCGGWFDFDDGMNPMAGIKPPTHFNCRSLMTYGRPEPFTFRLTPYHTLTTVSPSTSRGPERVECQSSPRKPVDPGA